mmetsp:Transcript_28482/g.53381  ORF Transcript_28482/g.53381 Transcript_28482/m.53381 type:complete len:528 (-) Transcript_28482:539-2122(-)
MFPRVRCGVCGVQSTFCTGIWSHLRVPPKILPMSVPFSVPKKSRGPGQSPGEHLSNAALRYSTRHPQMSDPLLLDKPGRRLPQVIPIGDRFKIAPKARQRANHRINSGFIEKRNRKAPGTLPDNTVNRRLDRPARPTVQKLAKVHGQRALMRGHHHPCAIRQLRLQPLDPVLGQQRDETAVHMGRPQQIAGLAIVVDLKCRAICAKTGRCARRIVDQPQRRIFQRKGCIKLIFRQAKAPGKGLHQRPPGARHRPEVPFGGIPPIRQFRQRRVLGQRVGRINGPLRVNQVRPDIDPFLVGRMPILQWEPATVDIRILRRKTLPRQRPLARIIQIKNGQHPLARVRRKALPRQSGYGQKTKCTGGLHDRGIHTVAGRRRPGEKGSHIYLRQNGCGHGSLPKHEPRLGLGPIAVARNKSAPWSGDHVRRGPANFARHVTDHLRRSTDLGKGRLRLQIAGPLHAGILLKIKAQRRPLSARARQAEHGPAATIKADTHALISADRTVHRIMIRKLIRRRDAQSFKGLAPRRI